jgi:polysaccharide deacetylase family protein (PEP-CTERM system associated)
MKNALTIDVEDYFQVAAFAQTIDRKDWDTLPVRVEKNVDTVLAALSEAQVKATFFTLGWVAERYPSVVKAIVAGGHELASHGYSHHFVHELSRAEFLSDIRRAKALLEDLSGQAILGYRAPSFSIGSRNLWALDDIRAAGHTYSSSIYPVHHDLYGMPHAPRGPFELPNGLLEIPMTTVQLGSKNLPAGGGGFFRLYPYALSRQLFQRASSANGFPSMFYAHPWEFDPSQPRVANAPLKSRFRHYLNLRKTLPRFQRLLKDFEWDSMQAVFLNRAWPQHRLTA